MGVCCEHRPEMYIKSKNFGVRTSPSSCMITYKKCVDHGIWGRQLISFASSENLEFCNALTIYNLLYIALWCHTFTIYNLLNVT